MPLRQWGGVAKTYIDNNLKIRNLAKGILPTEANWTIGLANLANITDENITTVTGNGIQPNTLEANDTNVKIDLGALYSAIHIYARYAHAVSNAVNTVTTNIRAGPAGTIGTDAQIHIDTHTGDLLYETQEPNYPIAYTGLTRYITMRQWVSAGNSYLRIYEIIVVGALIV